MLKQIMEKQPKVIGNTSTNKECDLQIAIWVSWQSHTRTRNIASHIGVPLEEIVTTNRTGLRRYIYLGTRTIGTLSSLRPKVLIVQNPSIVLTGLSLMLRWVFRYRLVVDAHNEAVEPYLHNSKVVLWLSRLYMKQADLTIVTNHALAEIIRKEGGRPIVLPDKVPEYKASISHSHRVSDKLHIVLVSTFAKDEPIREFLEAAGGYEDQISVSVTGCAEKWSDEVKGESWSNVRFTGFLEEKEYWGLLESADAVADLTRMDNCLVCGAYEGIAVGKPLILSDNEATRAHFRIGVLYVDNGVPDIRRALKTLLEKRAELQQQSMKLRDELRASWLVGAEQLVLALRSLA